MSLIITKGFGFSTEGPPVIISSGGGAGISLEKPLIEVVKLLTEDVPDSRTFKIQVELRDDD